MRDVEVPVPGATINVWFRRGHPTLVLVHGLSGTSRWFLPLINHLPATVGVVAPDLRGRGSSWRAGPPHHLPALADDLIACLDRLEIERAVLVGYSMGAWVASLGGARHPDRVEAVALLDGGLPLPVTPGEDPGTALERMVGPAVARLNMTFPDQNAYLDFWRRHPGLAGRWHPVLDQVFSYEVEQFSDEVKVRVAEEAVVAGGSDFLFSEVARSAYRHVTAPVLVVTVGRGMLDEEAGFTPEEVAAEAVSGRSGFRHLHLPHLNHYSLVLAEGAATVATTLGRLG